MVRETKFVNCRIYSMNILKHLKRVSFIVFLSFAICGCENSNKQENSQNLRPAVDLQTNDDAFVHDSNSPAVAHSKVSPIQSSKEPIQRNPSKIVLSPNSSCDVLAFDAKKAGVHHLVISFEGLGSKYIGFVRKNITRKIQKELDYSFATKGYGWTDTQSASECIDTWSSLMKEDLKLTVVGHSFGAGIATFRLLDELKESGIHVNNVITLDPRTGSNVKGFKGKFMHFEKPEHVDQFVNFWQKNGLRGYGVEGAENIQINNSGHVGLATNKKIYNRIKQIIKETSDKVILVEDNPSDLDADLSFEDVNQDD